MKDWLDKLKEELAPVSEAPPKNGRSAAQTMKHLQFRSLCAAQRFLKKGVKAGLVKVVYVREVTDDGKRHKKVPYYVPG